MSVSDRVDHWLAWVGLKPRLLQLEMKDGSVVEGYAVGESYRYMWRTCRQKVVGEAEDMQS